MNTARIRDALVALTMSVVLFAVVGSARAAIVNTGNATASGNSGTASITHGLTMGSGDVIVAFVVANNNGNIINRMATLGTLAIRRYVAASKCGVEFTRPARS